MLISLTEDQYATFYRTLSILKDICMDIDITNGMIRQRTDNTGSIFEIDLSSIISRINLPLHIIKPKLDMLKAFIGNEVEILVEENTFTFRDQYQSYTIMNPYRQYITNVYLTEEELDALFKIEEEDVILRYDIPKAVTERIKVVTNVFNVNNVQLMLEGETAHVEVETQSNEQSARFLEGMITDRVLECQSSLVITPFTVDHDGDTEFKMYNIKDDQCVNKFSTYIDEVPVTIYSKSTLVEED